MDDVHLAVQDVFRDVFGDDDLVLVRETTAADIVGWNSLRHVELVVALESALGVRFTTAEIAGTREGNTVGDLLDLVTTKLEAAPPRR